MIKNQKAILRSAFPPDLCVVRGTIILSNDQELKHIEYLLFDQEGCLATTRHNAAMVSHKFQMNIQEVKQESCERLFDDSMPNIIPVH